MRSMINDGIVHMAKSPFNKNYQPSSNQAVVIPKGSVLEDIMDKAQGMYRFTQDLSADMNTVAECIMSTSYYEQIDHHLTEQAIQQFLQASRAYETVHNYGAVTGLIASRLMQIAHEHGTNQFQFDMNGIKPIDLFGSFLSPQKGN